MKRYAKFARTDPHPEIPFAEDPSAGLPTLEQALFWFAVCFAMTIAGCYLL